MIKMKSNIQAGSKVGTGVQNKHMSTNLHPMEIEDDSDLETGFTGIPLRGGGDKAEMCGMCGLATFIIALVLYSIGLFIFGIIAVVTDNDAKNSSNVPTHADHMWVVCVIFIVNWGLAAIAGAAKSTNSDGESEDNPCSRSIQCISMLTGMLAWIWGLVIFSNLDSSAKDFLDDKFPTMWLYFQMCIWTATTTWCIIVLVIIVGAIFMCCKD